MSDVTITIIGAGAIGTSLGLALKQLDDPPHLIGHDKNPDHTRQAMQMGAFDRADWNLIRACESADLIILAIPAAGIRPTLEAIAADLKPDAVLSDTAQTKAPIVRAAQSLLPDTVHFVGGNPIVSPAGSGPQHARADLFRHTLYCLTPAPTVAPEAVKLLEDMVGLIGATPFYLDPVEHDGMLGGVAGLPALLSLALMHSLGDAPNWAEMRRLASGLFEQVSAGATGDPDSLAETFVQDRANTLRWLKTAQETLHVLQKMVEGEEMESLAQWIDEAVVARARWQDDFAERRLSELAPKSERVKKRSLLREMFGFGRR